MGHYLLNFLLATGGMVVLLYIIYLYIRQHPQLGGMGTVQRRKGPALNIESVVNLEPRKRLYVVAYGQQRFLIATTMEKTELLSTLETEPVDDTLPVEDETLQTPPALDANPLIENSAGFMDRFRYSLRMVFTERFTGLGGK